MDGDDHLDRKLTLSSWMCSAETEMGGDGRNLARGAAAGVGEDADGELDFRECAASRLDSFGRDGEEDTAELPAVFDSLGGSSIDGVELGGHGG